jgi:pimeloyl-ACP methyl ester carboxylesterase
MVAASARHAPPPAREIELTIRGGRTRLWCYGPDDGRPQVLFLHGLRGDHHGLAPIVRQLTGLSVLVPDLPGFGASEPLPDARHNVDGYRAWTVELLELLAPDGDAVLAGHSFGSILAAATVAAGVAVRGLALISPIASIAVGGPRRVVTATTVGYHRLAAALPEPAGTALLRSRLMTRMASQAMVRTPDRELRRWIHAEHDRRFRGFANRRVLLEAFESSISTDVAGFAERMTVPTLLVAGAADDIAPPATQHELAGRLPDARLVLLPGTGHLAHYEAPSQVAAELATFVEAVRPRS